MFRAFFLRALRQVDERYGTYGSGVEICAQMRRAAKKVVILRGVTAIHEGLASPVPAKLARGRSRGGNGGISRQASRLRKWPDLSSENRNFCVIYVAVFHPRGRTFRAENRRDGVNWKE